MSRRIKYDQPLNRKIPPLFQRGGLLYKARELGAKIGFIVEMPEDHFTTRAWLNLYESARRELMDICFLEQRCASYAELSQIDWLKQAGHRLWFKDAKYPRCDMNHYIEKIEGELRVATEFIARMASTVGAIQEQVEEKLR